MAAKILLRTQTLLQPEHLNPWIRKELSTKSLSAKIYYINPMEFNLINKLLQANYTDPSLQEYREKAKDATSPQSLKNGLLKHYKRLVVIEEQNLRTRLVAEAHTQVSIAYPRKNKTHRIISNHYYQPGMVIDINYYVRNYNNCYRSTIPQDKTLGLLKPLLIPNRPQQHISIDFHKLPIDRDGYNIVIILVNRFSKRLFLIPYYKNINTKEAARLYIHYIYRIYRPLDTIILDHRPQFISAFWNKFTQILGIRLKLSIAYYPQIDS